jgi:hypothetical protein
MTVTLKDVADAELFRVTLDPTRGEPHVHPETVDVSA